MCAVKCFCHELSLAMRSAKRLKNIFNNTAKLKLILFEKISGGKNRLILSLKRMIPYSFRRYDEEKKTMEDDYPRNMKNWRGVPTPLDAVITWKDGTCNCDNRQFKT
jgi:hypothetical protein